MTKYKLPTLLLIIMSIISLVIVMKANTHEKVFSCTSKLDTHYPATASIHAVFQTFFYNDNTGLSTYRGVLKSKGERYIINRDIPFTITNEGNDGIMTLKFLGVLKKPNDNVPDDIMWNRLHSSGVKYYLSVIKTATGDFILTDRGSPIRICSNTVQ